MTTMPNRYAVIPGQAPRVRPSVGPRANPGLSREPMNRALSVMVGLVPTIHVFLRERAVFKTWMLATRASMTNWSSVAFMGSRLGPAGRPGMTVRFAR